MHSSFLSGASVALAGALALWSCGGSSAPSAPTPAPAPAPAPSGSTTVTVSIVGSAGNQAYRPNPVSANSGDTVMFRNNDTTMHHIVLDDGSADLGDVAPGATSRGITLRNTNATSFHCTMHSSMVGSINAAAAPDPMPCPDPSGYGC
jgi:aldose sugar dehydrogenase